mgnify:CR=1 FL=1
MCNVTELRDLLTDLGTVSAISSESWLALTNMSEGVNIEDTGGVVMTTVTLVPVGLADQSVPAESLPTLTPVPLLGVVVDTLRVGMTNLRGLVTLKGCRNNDTIQTNRLHNHL